MFLVWFELEKQHFYWMPFISTFVIKQQICYGQPVYPYLIYDFIAFKQTNKTIMSFNNAFFLWMLFYIL